MEWKRLAMEKKKEKKILAFCCINITNKVIK